MASNSHSGSRAAAAPGLPGTVAATPPSGRNTASTVKGQYPSSQSMTLSHRFPVNSLQEIKLQSGETFTGRIYCTDETTGSVVLQSPLVHTTIATEIRIISSESIVSHTIVAESSTTISAAPTPLMQPLSRILKKNLEDRERRAVRLAEESLRHINEKASAVGQAVFDRLLKACGEVVWAPGDSASILVLNQVQVDAPYQPENCKIISKLSQNGRSKQGALEDGSLDRVRKIVAAATTSNNASSSN